MTKEASNLPGTVPHPDDGLAGTTAPELGSSMDKTWSIAAQPPSPRSHGHVATTGRFSLSAKNLHRKTALEKFAPKAGFLVSERSYYHGPTAVWLRGILFGKAVAWIMGLAVALALLLPESCVLLEVSSNLVPDIILTIVMLLFCVEMVALTLLDSKYMLSFFQMMDMIGTVSMIFDLSYLAGVDAGESPLESNNSDAQENLILLRASRAAKIGARAGRLSRVLRILRFLPFLTSGSSQKSSGIASMISGQLSNLLATRVACLTIILIMVIPLFDMWTFPQSDYSLQTWTDRISNSIQDGRISTALDELTLMESFYLKHEYWPWQACIGSVVSKIDGDNDFVCSTGSSIDLSAWVPSRPGPSRMASSLRVHTDTFMVAFNMHSPTSLKSGLAIGTIFFIILLMIFSSLALSSAVTELAVRPLERMLATVRVIAQTVFKFSAEVGEIEDDERVDIDSSNEMKLLEKVVQKLAIVADLQTGKMAKFQATEGMRDEDIGILNMMVGKNLVDEQKNAAAAKKTGGTIKQKAAIAAPTLRLEDLGVSQDVFSSWKFNAIGLTRMQRIQFAALTIGSMHDLDKGVNIARTNADKLRGFIAAVEKEYLPVPFHNFSHAVDVLHSVSRLLTLLEADTFLTDLDQYVLLIAAVAHDLGHPGVNNGFLSEVGHELALQYNDRSPLENMHCAKLYTLVANPDVDVFSNLDKDQYKEARKVAIEVILHTDMMNHGSMVKDLQMTYQMNEEVFSGSAELDADTGEPLVWQVFSQVETKMLILECILHSADVSNPCRSWDTSHAWAMLCLEEFFAQGDQEKMLGIPVQFLNDRDKLNKPNSQIGFIEFMIAPFYTAQIRLWPQLWELGENLGGNLSNWASMWEKEVNPSEDEMSKVQGRVKKVTDNLTDAMTRGGIQPHPKDKG